MGKIYQFSYGENGFDSIKTIKAQNKVQACHIGRLVDKLNTAYENGFDMKQYEVETETNFSIKPIIKNNEKPIEINNERNKLFAKLKLLDPDYISEENISIKELKQKIQELEKENSDEELELDDEKIISDHESDIEESDKDEDEDDEIDIEDEDEEYEEVDDGGYDDDDDDCGADIY